MSKNVEAEIDRLYELPLSEFTAARQALAKGLSGEAAARVREQTKPTVPAWAVNQVYWRARPVYDRLMAAAATSREAHRRLLAGRKTDLREADRAHRQALSAAVDEAAGILEAEGHQITPQLRHILAQTLEALPQGTPGRLTRPLTPAGFEILAGLAMGASARARRPEPRRAPTPARPRAGAALDEAKQALDAARADVDRQRRAAQEAAKASARAARTLERAASGAERARREWEAREHERETADAAVEGARAEEAAALKALERAESSLAVAVERVRELEN